MFFTSGRPFGPATRKEVAHENPQRPLSRLKKNDDGRTDTEFTRSERIVSRRWYQQCGPGTPDQLSRFGWREEKRRIDIAQAECSSVALCDVWLGKDRSDRPCNQIPIATEVKWDDRLELKNGIAISCIWTDVEIRQILHRHADY